MHSWTLDSVDLPLVEAILRRLKSEPMVFYQGEGESRALVGELLKRRSKAWASRQQCFFPSCGELSIEASHSLSNKLMLRPIAERGHLLTPKLDHFGRKMGLEEVGVNKASVFPGFCKHHENEFTFESEGQLSNRKELQMQLFRAVCRDLHFLNIEIGTQIRNRDEVGARFRTWIEAQLDATPAKKTQHSELVNGIEAEFLGLLDLSVLQRQKNIDFITNRWFEPNARNFGKLLSQEFHDALILCPSPLPIALSAAVPFQNAPRDSEGTLDFEWLLYVNIFPNRESTLIHMCALKSRQQELETLAKSFQANGATMSRYVREWMIEHCDHWFVKPSYWNGLPEAVRQGLMADLNANLR